MYACNYNYGFCIHIKRDRYRFPLKKEHLCPSKMIIIIKTLDDNQEVFGKKQ